MSQRRKVDLGAIDLDAIQTSARRRGRKVELNAEVDLYNSTEVCDLVIDEMVGFNRDVGGTVSAVYDDMETATYARIMGEYIEDIGEINGYRDYHVVAKNEDQHFVSVSVER